MALTGKRVLVVEDEYIIAADFGRELTRRGAELVGPTAELARGLDLAASNRLDAAVLDLNLEGEWTYPLAERLSAADVPYLFVTGYDRWIVPAAFAAVPLFAKPYSVSAVMEGVVQLCDPQRRL